MIGQNPLLCYGLATLQRHVPQKSSHRWSRFRVAMLLQQGIVSEHADPVWGGVNELKSVDKHVSSFRLFIRAVVVLPVLIHG